MTNMYRILDVSANTSSVYHSIKHPMGVFLFCFCFISLCNWLDLVLISNNGSLFFFQLTVDNSNFTTEKCFLPDERTVIATYIIGGVLIVLWVLVRLYLRLKNREPPYRVSLKHR